MITADILYVNGRFYTMKAPGDTVEAVAVLNGKIVFTGSLQKAGQIPAEKVVDLKGKPVIPGFTDTHLHLIMDCQEREKVNLTEADSISQVIDLMKERQAQMKETDQWLMGAGLHVERLKEGRFPNRHELDRISKERPIYIFSYCHHAGMANTKALALAGIGKGFRPEVEGTVEFEEDGSPSGIVREMAYDNYFVPVMNDRITDPAYRKALMEKLAPAYSKMGMTTLHTFSSFAGDPLEYLYMYQELEEEGKLPFRIRLNSSAPLAVSIGAVTGMGSDMVKYGAKKIFCDGSLSSRSAALIEPYADAPEQKGILFYSQEELTRQIKEAYEYGMETAIHAIGDRAMEMVLNGIEEAIKTARPSRKGMRFRLIHDILLKESHIRRMKALPVILDVQPIFIRNWVRLARERVGTERLDYFLPFRTFLENGLIVTGGSDAPVDDVNPMIGIQCAVTRQDLTGFPPEGLCPGEAISVYDAVCLYTKNAAYCCNEENERGTLEKGKFADFIVLDRDIFQTDPHGIHKIQVIRTVVGGKTVYEA